MATGSNRVALVLGDPGGIGPELVAKLLADKTNVEDASVLLIADRAEVDLGAEIAGVPVSYRLVNSPDSIVDAKAGEVLLFHHRGDAVGPFARAASSENGGVYTLATLAMALDLARSGIVDSVCYAPLNKASLHKAGMTQSDELHWFVDFLEHDGAISEINIMSGFWTSRITSHVALKDVAGLLTAEKIAVSAQLLFNSMTNAGRTDIKLGVCGLNPHNGDDGAFGSEESEIIEPGIALAQKWGIPAKGPYAPDTVFVRAQEGELNAIVTMYHDQGQIAMKLMGFWQGVTLNGGLDIPVVSAAHGTAFDIYGKGVARVGPMEAAFSIAKQMGRP